MPELPFPEIMLRVAAPAPPIVLLAVPAKMPSAPLPRAALPAALMPIKFAVMVSPPFCTSAIPCLEKRLITSPRTVVFPPAIEIPSTLAPALVPLISITGVPAVQPGWLVPSTKTGFVIAGRAEASVMVCTPPPGILKVIEVKAGLALTSRIACRSEPAPESFVLVTTGFAAQESETENSTVANNHKAEIHVPGQVRGDAGTNLLIFQAPVLCGLNS